MAYPKPLTERSLEKRYQAAGLTVEVREYLYTLFAACANLYGAISLRNVWKIYQEIRVGAPSIRRKELIAFSEIVRREKQPYYLLEIEELYEDEPHDEMDRHIVAEELVFSGYQKFAWVYELLDQAVDYPYFVTPNLLEYAVPVQTAEEEALLTFLGRLKVTADESKPKFGKAYPCEHKGQRLSEFSFLNSNERFEVDWLKKRPTQQAKFLAECAGSEAEKIVRHLRRKENVGIFSATELFEDVFDELGEVGVRINRCQFETLIRLMTEYHNNSRLWCICGWKPTKLTARYRGRGTPSITFGPGLQKAFADGTIDREELIRISREMGIHVLE